MKFAILGPFEVLQDGQDVTPAAAKLRQVLGLLVLRRNHVVHTDLLIDELWGEDPPRSALATLQTYVYKLRGALGEAALAQSQTALRTRPSGYVLEVAADQVDAAVFEQLLEDGRAALGGGDPGRAVEVLTQACALWRGPAFADVLAGPVLASHATRLDESRLSARELRIEAHLRLDRHHEVLGDLRELAAAYPLDEGYVEKLMIALDRAGRRVEALDVYRRTRDKLIEDFGLEPSRVLSRLQQAILASSGEPGPQRGDRGLQPDGPATLAAAPAAGGMPIKPAQLPPDTLDFVGRDDVLGELSELLAPSGLAPSGLATSGLATSGLATSGLPSAGLPSSEPPPGDPAPGDPASGDPTQPGARIIALSGLPGAGKTAVATRAAHRVRDLFGDGQLFADLRGSTERPADPAEVLHGFLRAAGVPPGQVPHDLDEAARLFRDWTARRSVLLLLDDAYSAAQVRWLLPRGARCAAIVTSRSVLPDLAGAASVRLDMLSTEEAVALLASLAGHDRVARERGAAREIVRLCGLLPLAVCVAGIRLAGIRGWRLSRLAALLDDPRRRLAELRLRGLDVQSRFEVSYSRLGGPEKSTFRLLSVLREESFPAGRVAGMLGCGPAIAEEFLSALVDGHLLVAGPRDDDGAARYGFHELTRAYASERLEAFLAEPFPVAVADSGDYAAISAMYARQLRALNASPPARGGIRVVEP
jgi:DNA-binding SARP family transcriptional activator